MVVITQSVEPVLTVQQPVSSSELCVTSGRCVRYVAPFTVEIAPASEQDGVPSVKRTDYNQLNDSYEGVSDFCQALDDMIEIEKDTELLAGKSVLEIGFTTGIPSVFALDGGANDVTLHSWDKLTIDQYIKPTIRRNNVPRNMYKVQYSGDFQTCIQNLGTNKYDVVLAPEFTMADEEMFDELHDILDAALAPNGIILLSGRPYYPHCSGSIQAFLDLIKTRNCFDAHVRWTSPKSDLAPRKCIQLTRYLR